LYKKFNIFVQRIIEMLTNIDIDQEKIAGIMAKRNFKSKKEVVDKALELLLKQITREEILKWKGSDAWEGDLDEMRSN
jgi:Arc/MetJ family transcription regulator